MRKSNRNKSEYMRNRILFAISICFCFVVSSAQECDNTLETARFYKNKGNYEKAVRYYQDLNKNCPNYVSAKVKEEWNYCKQQLNQSQNKPIPAIPSGQHVEKKPQPGSPTSPETTLGQYGRVKVSFDAGKATPICENVRNVIKKLEDYDTLGLQIEIPWCRDMYSLQLIEKRIRNITEIFIASGIDEGRVASKITMVDVLESCDGLSNDYDHDRIAEHITLINVDDGYNACDSAWLKIVELPKEIPFEIEDEDHVPIRDLSDRLARMSISFRNYDDSPQIVDVNDCVLWDVRFLKKNNTFNLLIEVYTYATEEAPATEEYIRDLCVRRANRLRDMYIQMGASPDKIETVCYSNKDPQDSHSPNNRAYVRFVKREESPKQSEEEDLADLRELSEILSEASFKFLYFGEDESEIVIISFLEENEIEKTVDILNRNKSLKLIVECYSCEGSTELFKKNLAQSRASWARKHFILYGVNPDQIEYVVKDSPCEQNAHDTDDMEFGVAFFRAEKREAIPYKKSKEDDVVDIKDLSDALSNIKILFNYDQDVPTIKDQDGNIYKAAAVLNKNESLKVIIEVSTEGYGERQKDLAQRRANNVIDLFIKRGVSSDQLDVNMDGDSQNLNKSVVFRIVKK